MTATNPTPAPILQVRGLRKTFRDFWGRPRMTAVADLDLTVQAGEIFGLLGPNGSGKSTTIKMLLGLLRPSSGTLRVFGGSPQDVRTRARLGYLPELTSLHPFLTPRETLDYYGALFGLDPRTRAQRTAELLAMVDLEAAADRPIGEFSKGMARRVGLAQALVNRPDLVVLDEPTSGLDPIGCRAVKDLLLALARSGTTVLMSSHLLADVEDVCDRVAILHAGRVRAEGRVTELLRCAEDVRFTVQGLDSSRIDAARQTLAAQTGRAVAVDHPSLTLETFFLRVVAASSDRAEAVVAAFRPAPFLVAEQPPTSDSAPPPPAAGGPP